MSGSTHAFVGCEARDKCHAIWQGNQQFIIRMSPKLRTVADFHEESQFQCIYFKYFSLLFPLPCFDFSFQDHRSDAEMQESPG